MSALGPPRILFPTRYKNRLILLITTHLSRTKGSFSKARKIPRPLEGNANGKETTRYDERTMFEAAELGSKTSKEEYKKIEPSLRVSLLTVQYELRESDFPLVLVLAGNDRLGCTEVANLLHEWMDPRYITAHFFEEATQEERARPPFWRYWRRLPARGQIGIYSREWTLGAVLDRAVGKIDEVGLDRRVSHIQNFEKALIDDGALILKFWLHLPKKALKKRLDRAEKDSGRLFRVTKGDRRLYKLYDDVREVSEEVVRRTSRGAALWNVVESTDARYRDVTVAQILLEQLTKRLQKPKKPRTARPKSEAHNPTTVLDKVDLTNTLEKKSYERKLAKYWARFAKLNEKAHKRGIASVLAFEGWDAAGKGGVIRRLTHVMDAAHYRVLPIAAPTDEELAHHYLWRFWRNLPQRGHVAIFDRSWYGRVLVERVEGFASEAEWKRAYAEINDFEEQLANRGMLVLKFWIHISLEEQLRRFKAREKVPFKKYKITPDDYRNREKWNDYELAANEMLMRTSTDHAPWCLIPGNDKRVARIEVLRAVCRALKKILVR